MKRDLAIKPIDFNSSFHSCEKDYEIIMRRLFIESQPYSDELKRLLVINAPDCLDNKDSQVYKDALKRASVDYLDKYGYIRMAPKIKMPEHEEIKSYLVVTFDNFYPSKNPQFRDCNVNIDILCHVDYWNLGKFRQRPIKIAGYIDGLLNNSRLTGLGKLEFAGANMLVLDEVLSGYTLMYNAVHGTDDKIEELPEQQSFFN